MWLLDPVSISFIKSYVIIVRMTILYRGMLNVDAINLSLVCPPQGLV